MQSHNGAIRKNERALEAPVAYELLIGDSILLR